MPDPIPRSIREAGSHVLEALLRLASEDTELRRSLTTVNAWLARELNDRAAAGASELSSARDLLTPRSTQEPSPVSLARIALRAGWKAEALQLAVDRRTPPAEGKASEYEANLRSRESDLRRRQSSAGGPWAWMLDAPPARVETADLSQLGEVYGAVAIVAHELEALESSSALLPSPPVDLLRLVAEAQSMLLAALAKVGIRQDEDQRDLFQWLRDRTTRHRVYVDRFMRLGDPADPALAADLRQRFDEAAASARQSGAGRKERAQLLNKVRYHVRKLIDVGQQAAGEESDSALAGAEWRSLSGALDQWRERGLALDDRELRDLLGPLSESSTEDLGTEVGDVLREALASLAGSSEPRQEPVTATRALVGGGRALLISAQEDEGARAQLQEALGLAELTWLTVENDDAAGAERLARVEEATRTEGLDLVFMGVRLPREEYLAFKELCVELGRPFVRLPGPMEPHAVAHQTVRQVGWRLRQDAPSQAQ